MPAMDSGQFTHQQLTTKRSALRLAINSGISPPAISGLATTISLMDAGMQHRQRQAWRIRPGKPLAPTFGWLSPGPEL